MIPFSILLISCQRSRGHIRASCPLSSILITFFKISLWALLFPDVFCYHSHLSFFSHEVGARWPLVILVTQTIPASVSQCPSCSVNVRVGNPPNPGSKSAALRNPMMLLKTQGSIERSDSFLCPEDQGQNVRWSESCGMGYGLGQMEGHTLHPSINPLPSPWPQCHGSQSVPATH